MHKSWVKDLGNKNKIKGDILKEYCCHKSIQLFKLITHMTD